MKRISALVIVPIAALSLAACGDDGNSGESTSGHSMAPSSAGQARAGQHNDQDVMFAQMMIPHHQQAIQMAKQARARASAPEVKRLAASIEKAQSPEIKQMSGWLKTWGVSMPWPGEDYMGNMDHGGGMPGMMSSQDMKRLSKLSGKAYDKAFLQMMIKHHQGAVVMAKAEQAKGTFPQAKTLAGAIITSQSAEITKMRALLTRS